MSKTAAFPKILHIGDKQILDLFEGEVEITEKLDGSQFSFGKIDGEVITRSKGREFEEPDKLFRPVFEYVHSIADRLPEGIFFYGETLGTPRHSTLAYDWTRLNTGKGKFDVLKENYRTEARWNKAIQHLKENGELTGTPKDIGGLLKEIYVDIETEEKENIKDQLYSIYKSDIMKYATHGLAQWYKEKLVKGEINGNN